MNTLRLASPTHLQAIALIAALTCGCTVQNQTQPGLSGPSELGLSLSVVASPQVLPRDGSSMSTITLTAWNADGTPRGNQRLILSASAGTLSVTEVITGSNGGATVTYIAPGLNESVSSVTIRATPVESGDAANSITRTVRISVLGPSVPVAAFTFTPNTPPTKPAVLDVVTFNASGSTIDGVACRSSCTYSWDFGDGSTGNGLAVQHPFAASGVINVTLTVTFTAAGTSDSVTEAVIVAPPALPVAEFTFGVCVTPAPKCFRFNDASTVGPGATISGYLWDFGDSTSPATTSPVEHTYTVAGSYNVKLTVTDSLGRASTPTTKPVTVP